MKTSPVEAEFFLSDGRQDRLDEADSRFRNFSKYLRKKKKIDLLVNSDISLCLPLISEIS
jgi:hypothetical protein